MTIGSALMWDGSGTAETPPRRSDRFCPCPSSPPWPSASSRNCSPPIRPWPPAPATIATTTACPTCRPTGWRGRVGLLRDASGALSGVDTDDLEPADQVDHEQLLSLVERSLFALTEVREYEWNPLAHNPGILLHAVLARPFAPAEQRSRAGRAAGGDPGRAGDRAGRRWSAARGSTSRPRPASSAAPPSLIRDRAARPARAGARAEVHCGARGRRGGRRAGVFAQWCAAAAAGPDEGRDPRLGRRLWEAKLWHTLDTELTAAEVLRLARATLDRGHRRIREAAVELVGGRSTTTPSGPRSTGSPTSIRTTTPSSGWPR